MTKGEAELAIRNFCQTWQREIGMQAGDPEMLSFYGFLAWLRDNYPAYLNFRTTTSVTDDVERWFENELGLTAWR